MNKTSDFNTSLIDSTELEVKETDVDSESVPLASDSFLTQKLFKLQILIMTEMKISFSSRSKTLLFTEILEYRMQVLIHGPFIMFPDQPSWMQP